MKTLIKRYRLFILALLLIGASYFIRASVAFDAIDKSLLSLKEMVLIMPPIFILIGLLDVWVSKETLSKYMGEKSGILGAFLAFVLGAISVGPLYGAFPIAAVLLKKGAKLFHVIVFLGAWSTTKIPMFLFEIASLGPTFALARMAINIPGILLISYLYVTFTSKEEKAFIYANAETF